MRPRALAFDQRGALTLTLAQIFLGTLTMSVALFRGAEASMAFHRERNVAAANLAASIVASHEARAANIVATNNAVAAGLLGPRLAVEADSLTMELSGKIACASPHLRHECARYVANEPRIRGKLLWIREQQDMLWRALHAVSAEMQQALADEGERLAVRLVQAHDPSLRLEIERPPPSAEVWDGDGTARASRLATRDALSSDIIGTAFPLLMKNFCSSCPTAFVQKMGSLFGGEAEAPLLDEVLELKTQAQRSCSAEEATLADQSNGLAASADDDSPSTTRQKGSVSSSPYWQCTAAAERTNTPRAGYLTRAAAPPGWMLCTFQRDLCTRDQLRDLSHRYLEQRGLVRPSDQSGPRTPGCSDWNRSPSFQVRVTAEGAPHESVFAAYQTVRSLASFASSPVEHRSSRDVACGQWYFSEGPSGKFGSVAHEDQPFVASWSFRLTTCPKEASL